VDEVNAEFIERYQKLYEQDPKSRVFAPLAEGYRKMGLLKEALEVAEMGVKTHPTFPGGRVALGRIYADTARPHDAEREFRKAAELSPENLLAHQLLAETCLKLKKTKDALRAYKMILFLNPDNDRALKAVRKLEALTADEYDDEIFAMKPLREAVREWDVLDLESPKHPAAPAGLAQNEEKKSRFLERVLSLADAYMTRSDIDRALDALNEAERLLGPHPEVIKRLKLIHQRQLDHIPHPRTSAELLKPTKPTAAESKDPQVEFLEGLLLKFKQRDISR
jgi:tetratricopeptide (TPR) repeat protein